MIPFEVLGLPLYTIFTGLHFDNSFQAIVLPFVANGLVIFLFRQFFTKLPRELLDAGRVDGLSWFGVYFRIVVPLTIPVMISGGLILFLSQWESLFWPLLIANSSDHQMVQVVIANFRTQYATNWDQLFSEAVVIVVIPIAMLLVLQRYYVRTIATTGLRE